MFIYFRLRLICVLILGMMSGLPLALTASSLIVMLHERGLDVATLGAFALVGLPYSFKFLWAPMLDTLTLGVLTRWLGRRKSQLFIVSLLVAVNITLLGMFCGVLQPIYVAVLAISLAFFSASNDVVIDATRIEMLELDTQVGGASMAIGGYRLGMITSSAGALTIAHFAGWSMAYFAMAVLLMTLLCVVLFLYREEVFVYTADRLPLSYFRKTFWEPLYDIWKRTNFFYMLIFVIFFKLSDALLMSLTSPFLLHIGFDKLDIALVAKTFGVFATIGGAILGGYIASRVHFSKFLYFGLVAEMISNLSYLLLLYFPKSMHMLFAVTTIEYTCSGISTAALVAYISAICNKQFSAGQYALMSAFATFGRTLLAASAGVIVENVGWELFFICTAAASLPSLFLVRKAAKIRI